LGSRGEDYNGTDLQSYFLRVLPVVPFIPETYSYTWLVSSPLHPHSVFLPCFEKEEF